jgi:hypothetical protein
MKLEFTLDPADYDAFHQDYYRTAPEGRRTMRVGRWGLPAVVVVLVVGQIALAGYDPIWTPLLFGYAASWAAVFPRLVGWVTARRTRRWARRDAGTAAFAPQTLEFSDQGIAIAAAGGSSQLPWAAVQRVSQGPQHVFLYLDSRRALVVPLRACADSEAQALLLEDCLKRHAAAATGNG